MGGVRSFIVCLYKVSRDLLLGLLLLVLGLLLSPLVYLRGSTMPERSWNCLRVLLAQGMFARFVRVAVEWRLGNFNFALIQLESVVTTMENSITVQRHGAVAQSDKSHDKGEPDEPLNKKQNHPQREMERESGKSQNHPQREMERESGKEQNHPQREMERESGKEQNHPQREMVLQDLYTLLARMYLYSGHIDGALLLTVRVRKVLGIDRLPALPELDVKTAHLVRASMAAGRLLDGTSLATLVVKTTLLEPQNSRSRQSSQGKQATRHRNAKVIPFPSFNPK